MGTREESVREIVKDLDGLLMLNEWEVTLVRDLRQKAEALLNSGGEEGGPGGRRPEEPPTESGKGRPESAV